MTPIATKLAARVLLGTCISLPATALELELPQGFEASVFHEGVGRARHIAVSPDGDIFVRLATEHDDPGVLRLRDTDGDHRAEETVQLVSDAGGTGIKVHDGQVVYSTDTAVYAFELSELEEGRSVTPRTVIEGFPKQRQHAAKSLALTPDDTLFVNVGAPSNACQKEMRTPGSPGLRPCPQLIRQSGIWRTSLSATNQTQEDATHYVTGLRGGIALAWNPAAQRLYLVQHGRDQLHSLWSEHYTEEQNARLPAEEFHALSEGDNLGWPYTYYDGIAGRRMLAPEYGGNGQKQAEEEYAEPLIAFPAHWAPNDMLFYQGSQFPENYRNGAFIAFHGSWNRAPLPQEGYNVVFAPMNDVGEVTGEWSVFAGGFAGEESPEKPKDARYRPTGVAEGPDGSLYIVDSTAGRIWKVRYVDGES